MKAAVVLLLSLAPCACSNSRTVLPLASSASPPSSKVALADGNAAVLEEWRARQEARERADGDCNPQFTAWSEIDTAPLRRLFPAYRFFAIRWDQRPVDPTKPSMRSYAFGLSVTLAVARDSHSTAEFSHYGNYEPFGDFLRRERIAVPDEAAARMVWDAFCDLHQKRWAAEHGIERVSPTLWRLGGTTIDRFRYYYEVVIDAQGLVQRGELCAVGN